ncbi:ArnT family glycosyltransferase [Alteromonas lipolytica]|nr:glycosyltransferase family 39 protein [Alteromonas lipolytica]GGF62056.1 glycosyl transferase [Alteromonas lipolytica]
MLPDFSRYQRADMIWLALITFALLALGIGFRAPWPADEPRFALIAKDMVESGQWLFPMRGNELYPDKPPLFMWSIAVFYALTGSLYVAFLLPSAIAGTVTVLAVFDICRRLWGSREAWWAAGLLLASVQFVLQAKSAQIDASVCMWVTLGCYGLLRATLCHNAHAGWWLAGCVAMGLGIMTKGVGFLPLLMLVPYAIACWRKRPEQSLPQQYGWLWWPTGIVVMLLALLLWLWPMLNAVDSAMDPAYSAYRDNIMMKQTVTRYANSWHHIKPFWYFVASVVPWAWLPLVVLIPWQWRHWSAAWKANDARILMPLGFVLLVLLFFSLSPGKRGVYILPALPMLALAMAPAMPHIADKKGVSRILWALPLLIGLGLLVVGLLGFVDKGPLAKMNLRYAIDGSGVVFATGAAVLLALFMLRHRSGWQAWGITMLVVWCSYSVAFASLLNPVRTPSSVWQNIDSAVPVNAEIALLDTGEQFMLFARRPIVHFGYHTPPEAEMYAAWKWLEAHKDGYVLLPSTKQSPCFDLSKGQSVGTAHREDWLLLGPQAMLGQCQRPEFTPDTFRYVPINPLIK